MRARDRDLPAFAGAEHGVEAGLVGIGDALAGVPASLAEAVAARSASTARRRPACSAASPSSPTARSSGPEPARRATRSGASPARGATTTGPRRARSESTTSVRARWLSVSFGPDAVPVAVAETFARGGRNLQRIHSDLAERQSVALWTD